MNPSISIGLNSWVTIPITAFAADGTTPVDPASINGTATISDYSKAYVAFTDVFSVVPKQQPAPGTSFTVTLQVNPVDKATGIALPPQSFDVIVSAPHPDQVAFSTQLGPATLQTPIDTLHGTPSDPGSGTVPFGS